MKSTRLALVLCGVAVGSMLVMGPTATPALAHTGITSSSPKAGAKLERPPRRVTVTFSAEPRTGSLVVRNSTGRVVSRGPNGKDPANVRRLRVTLVRGLSQGRYTVHWKITTADGHRQSGRFSFRVVP